MDGFFRACAETDEISAYDLLFHRYGCIPQIGFSEFVLLIQRAKEEEKRNEIYLAWLQLFPLMQEGKINFVSFNEYYDTRTGKNIDTRSADEIRAEVEEIRSSIRKEK